MTRAGFPTRRSLPAEEPRKERVVRRAPLEVPGAYLRPAGFALRSRSAAWAAASLATGTRNGEQDT